MFKKLLTTRSLCVSAVIAALYAALTLLLAPLSFGPLQPRLSEAMTLLPVVLPQAIRTMIPSIINQFIITLKDTSILSVIGFPELVNTAKNVVANTFMSFQTWGIVAIMYLIVITALSRFAKSMERRMNRGR